MLDSSWDHKISTNTVFFFLFFPVYFENCLFVENKSLSLFLVTLCFLFFCFFFIPTHFLCQIQNGFVDVMCKGGDIAHLVNTSAFFMKLCEINVEEAQVL